MTASGHLAKPTASVIVLTYNARAFVERCLTALAAQTFADFETIVVDNASPDGTAEFVRGHFPAVQLVVSTKNDGYGAGNNLGAGHASGEVLVFLNPDAVPEADWLTNLLKAMHQYGRRFATSRIVLQSDPSRLNSGGNLIHYLGLSFCRGLNEPLSNFNTAECVSAASGAACAISRELFERIGGFDPTFFLYHDDVDLSLRALLAGEPCLYVPEAVVSHDYRLTIAPTKWRWVEAHRYAVLMKTYNVRTLLLLIPALLGIDAVTFAYLALRGPQFVAAKARTYSWLLRNLPNIVRNRRRAQSTRVVSDRQLISALVDRVPYEQLGSPITSMIATALLDPFFRLYRRMMLALMTW